MPRRTIDSVKLIMDYARSKGFEKEMPAKEFIKLIELCCGMSPNVQRNYISFMQRHEFIKIENGIVKLDHEKLFAMPI